MEEVVLNTGVEEFFQQNEKRFEDELLSQAVNVKDMINHILEVGNIDLINNAHKLVYYVLEGKEDDLKSFAKQEGIAWATYSMEVSFKLEWVQAIRRTMWKFMRDYFSKVEVVSIDDFFSVEHQINNRIDQFLNAFFINYSTYKDQLLQAQRELVDNLSVPIIPITPTISILPLIGAIDYYRASVIEEKVLQEIARLHIETLIMDLSGIADMENEVIDHIMKILDGTSLMGCSTVITGLRPDVVRKMIHLGVKFDLNTKTLGTLQHALNTYLSR